jgi:Tfp pilus assembly protein PilO
MKLSPRNTLIASAVGAVLLVIVLVVVLVVPQFGKLGDLGEQISTADAEATAATMLLAQRREIKNSAAVTNNTLLTLANAVPENPELPSLIIELQDSAYASDVSLRGVTPALPAVVEDQTVVSVPLSLEVWGTWSDTVDFLQRLQKLGRSVRVTQFEAMVIEESVAHDANIKLPPYYQVRTVVALETYVIPAGSESATDTSVPAPEPVN